MTNLITHNPYRILGVYSDSPKREVLANLNKITAFLKVGKEVSFPLDLPALLTPITRVESIVSAAQSAIELPSDQLKHALFWFRKATSIDEIALNHLLSGNIAQAKQIWGRKEDVSSLLNLMACALIQQDLTSFALKADTLFQTHASELCASVNETLKLSSSQLTDLLVETLKADGSIDLATLATVPGTSTTWRKAFGETIVKPYIDKINQAIAEAANANGSVNNYKAGTKLMMATKDAIAKLKEVLGASDMEYQMIVDKLALTILQCGINYFNDSEDDDAPQRAMTLQKYALSIAVGQMAKQRCKENVEILQNYGPEYAVRKEMASIADKLKRFQSISKATEGLSYSGIISPYSIPEIETFINNCIPDLQAIKSKLGITNNIYIKISSSVTAMAIHALVDVINKAQILAPIGSSKASLKSDVSAGLSLMSKISSLDMDKDCREYFNKNQTTLNSLNSQLNPPSSGGCYIATMVYGDYDHPQVKVLRDFRDSYLAKRHWGRQFIGWYYAHSPNWVEKLKNYHLIHSVIRNVLDTFIKIYKKR